VLKHLARMEQKCMQDFGRKTHDKVPIEGLDVESNVTLTQI
jgi:hypothetical protein